MYGEEFKARALEVLEECSGSCIRAARKPGIVSSKALQRWKNDLAEPPERSIGIWAPSKGDPSQSFPEVGPPCLQSPGDMGYP